MKVILSLMLCIALLIPCCVAEGSFFEYRFADAEEAAQLRLSNRDYFESMTQNDLNYRMQKLDATLSEFEAFAAAQFMDFTDAEKAAIDEAMARIEGVCAERGYSLPTTDGIVFCKSTMDDECDAGGYTHGTQIYLGETLLAFGCSGNPGASEYLDTVVFHELFHCLTRNHPDFRAEMYGILGFTVTGQDFDLADSVKEKMISNPDVEHHDAWVTFDIDGEAVDCVVVFAAGKPFEKPGDSFFDGMVTGLVPINDLSTMYTSDDAANFRDVFGENTPYVIDPEETMADNFSFTIVYGEDGMDYPTPEIIEKIEACLKEEAA